MAPISEYLDYRAYLRDFYAAQKRHQSGFTYARFSQRAGIRSPNYLKLVMDGKKNLTLTNMSRFAKALELDPPSREYFLTLVQFNQAKTPSEREFNYQQLLQRRAQWIKADQARRLKSHEFEVLSSWIHHAIMVMTNLPNFLNVPQWISQKLFHFISPAEVTPVLQRLFELGLIRANSNGRFQQTHRQVKTDPELRNSAGKIFYQGLLQRAAKAFDHETIQEREFSAQFVTLSAAQFEEYKSLIRNFMSDLNERSLISDDRSRRVYALMFGGFPLTSEK